MRQANITQQDEHMSAGEKFRLMQAVELIQSFRATIVVDGQEVDAPVYVPSDSDPDAFELNPLLERQETAQNENALGGKGGGR